MPSVIALAIDLLATEEDWLYADTLLVGEGKGEVSLTSQICCIEAQYLSWRLEDSAAKLFLDFTTAFQQGGKRKLTKERRASSWADSKGNTVEDKEWAGDKLDRCEAGTIDCKALWKSHADILMDSALITNFSFVLYICG